MSSSASGNLAISGEEILILSGISAALWHSMTWLTPQLLSSIHRDLLLLTVKCRLEEVPRGNGREASSSHQCHRAVLEEMVYRPTYILNMYVGR